MHNHDETHLDFYDQPDESPYRHCRSCDVLAFDPSSCEKCGLLVCTDCGEKCDTCQQWYCAEKIGNECLNAHGCKRKADPADVLCIEAGYLHHPNEYVGEVYSINGHTYFTTHPRSDSGFAPRDVLVYQYKGTHDTGLDVENVGRFDAVLNKTIWDTDEVEADHVAAEG